MRRCEDKFKHFDELVDLSQERCFWLDLTDYEVVKVLRYLIEFTRSDLPNRHLIMDYLCGFIQDIEEDHCNDHFDRWFV